LFGGKALVSPSAFLAAAGARVPPCAQQLAPIITSILIKSKRKIEDFPPSKIF
jgi:hypothetical protein